MTNTAVIAREKAAPESRPGWSRWGGGALLVGALALLVATVVEYSVWQTTTLGTTVFVVFSVLFFVNVVLYLVAMGALAFAGGGIVGPSLVGKTGLVLFGLGWAAMQLIYWASYFMTTLPQALDALGTVALVVAYLGAAAAAVMIALGRVVRGPARWALIVGFVIAGVCAGLANSSSDEVLRTVLLSVSCAAQGFVGLSYLRAR